MSKEIEDIPLSDLEYMVVSDMLGEGIELSFEPYTFEKGQRKKLIDNWWKPRLEERPYHIYTQRTGCYGTGPVSRSQQSYFCFSLL